jgi:hypothetical protein
MTAAHPHFKPRPVKNKRTGKVILMSSAVAWVGEVQPTPLSRKYQIKIEYRADKSPMITVLSPKLALLEGWSKPPHTYREGNLCLYTPSKREWHAGKSIASTIVPWISLWLFYYEAWLITGKWLGDGTEPSASEVL